MSIDYNNPLEKRIGIGQRRVKEAMEEFETLWRRLELANVLTHETKMWIMNDKLEFENANRLLMEKHIRDEIQYLKEQERTFLPNIKVEEVKV